MYDTYTASGSNVSVDVKIRLMKHSSLIKANEYRQYLHTIEASNGITADSTVALMSLQYDGVDIEIFIMDEDGTITPAVLGPFKLTVRR